MSTRRSLSTALLLTLLASLLAVLPAAAQTSDLIISEYIEGSSNNKAIEIYNGTADPVDLAAEGYSLQYFFNGSASAGLTINLIGSVASGDVHVVAQSSAAAEILAVADQTNGAGWFNGDDAVVLRRAGAPIDVIGQIGFDPGAEWGSGLTSTADNTLRRLPGVCTGDPVGDDPFDPAVEWAGFATNTFDGLGSHVADCGGGPVNAAPTVTSAPETLIVEEGDAASAQITAQDDGTVVSLTLTDATALPAGVTFTSTGPASGLLEVQGTPPGTYTISYTAIDDLGATGTGTTQVTVPLTALISAVQGAGDSSPLVDQLVIVEAVVVGDFQDGAFGEQGDLNGFFIQEEDADADADPLTSEGLFVFNGSNPTVDVAVGDLVRVTGTVSEFNGATQISAFDDDVEVLASGVTLPTAASPVLPAPDAGYLERFENMLVTFDQPLYVSEHFNLDRFGEMALSSEPFLQNPTQVAEPGDAANAIAAANDLSKVTIDDGRTIQNPDPIPFVEPPLDDGTYTDNRRRGDSITGLTGPLAFSFGLWRVQVDVDVVTTESFTDSTRTRPDDAPDLGGTLRVASFNVLNYFSTLDLGPDICGPDANQECRGADSQLELDRQTAKTVDALIGLDADIVGLIEIQNDDGEATEYLVDALNASLGESRYAYVDTGFIGTDAIKQAFIYDRTTVEPIGDFAILDSSVDPRFDDSRNRPALAQSFRELATGEVFTPVVNHLKSKGSACPGDPDTGDGQGNCNLTRLAAAEALADWLATDPTGSGDPDVLILGDLNSYAMEDPIQALEADGYTNLVAGSYGYVFDGEEGTLDYALANDALLGQVTGAAEWHINADEADLIDYNTDFGRGTGYFNPDIPYRSSDHDPVVVGLVLGGVQIAEDQYVVQVGATVTVTAIAPEGADLTWDLDGDGSFDDATGPEVTFRATRPPGEYVIAVQATTNGVTTTDTAALIVTTGSGSTPPGRS